MGEEADVPAVGWAEERVKPGAARIRIGDRIPLFPPHINF